MTVEIFVFCGWWFSNQFDIVLETHFRCDTVGRELWLAILNSLLCHEMDRNIRIGKQGYVIILPILRSDVWGFHSWHQLVCQQLFWHWERLNFLNKLISETFCLLGLLNLRLSNGSRLAKTKFMRGLVSLDCRLKLLKNFFWIIF